MLKSCSRCGKLHPHGHICTIGKTYNGGDERRLRKLNAWDKKSVEIRERANYLCEVCRDHDLYTYDRLEVHHIESVREAPGKLLDDNNLICLCASCHKEADRGALSRDYLYQLVSKRETKCEQYSQH